MASSDRYDVPPPVDPLKADRLDTWKEVAAHLRRSVRTVQRWEREEGLPLHRHRHDKQGSIYAFKAEVDVWWVARGAGLEESAGHPAEPSEEFGTSIQPPVALWPRKIASLAVVGPAGAGLAIVIVLMALTLSTDITRAPATPPPHGPHRLLITEFENLTGEPTVAGRLRDALQEQLSASRFADIVPPDQTAQLLRLMKRPPNTPIDASVGREICLWDGAIDGFVSGTVDKRESNYVATVRILTPTNASVVTSFSAQGRGQGQLLDAVRLEMIRVQGALDEHLSHDQRRPEVAKVTTASLHALQLYRQAADLMDQVPVKTGPALALLTEAIRLDPDFASAHILTAWALKNAGRTKEAFLPPAERALQLVDSTTDEERYFILGSYYQLTLNVEKATSAYEALLRLNPMHYWALGNLGRLYRTMGRHVAASELRARQVEIRPRQFWGAYRLSEALFLTGDLNGGRKYAVRAASLASQFDSGEMQSHRSWFEILPACEAWLQDDVAKSARSAHDLEATLSRREPADRDALTTSLGYWYLALGQRRAAERMFLRVPESEGRLYHLAVIASQYGERDTAKKYLTALANSVDPSIFILGLPTLDAGVLALADERVADWERKIGEPDAKLLRGQLALMKGHAAEARMLLGQSIDLREDRFGAPAFSASEGLARAWRNGSDWQQAIHVMEEASQNRFRSCLWPTASAHIWLRIRADLAQLYRQVGREEDALIIEMQLRNLLKYADDDHPLLARLNAVATPGAGATRHE